MKYNNWTIDIRETALGFVCSISNPPKTKKFPQWFTTRQKAIDAAILYIESVSPPSLSSPVLPSTRKMTFWVTEITQEWLKEHKNQGQALSELILCYPSPRQISLPPRTKKVTLRLFLAAVEVVKKQPNQGLFVSLVVHQFLME